MGEKIKTLDFLFESSAYRRGTSSHRLGLIPNGISDHLPIDITVSPSRLSGESDSMKLPPVLKILSWNLLSDDHLYCHFRNISGLAVFEEFLFDQSLLERSNLYSQGKLYHFFIEFIRTLDHQSTKLNLTLLEYCYILLPETFLTDNFLDQLDQFSAGGSPSRLCRDHDTIMNSRHDITRLIGSAPHHIQHEFILTLTHTVQIYNEIHRQDGSLRWKNRASRLKSSSTLLSRIKQYDVICFQECSHTGDIENLFQDQRYIWISHAHPDHTQDHCMIGLNSERFELRKEPIRFFIAGHKPAILLYLFDQLFNQNCIVGSIHHPGGKEDHLTEIIDRLNDIRTGFEPFYIAGDFNHTQNFFSDAVQPMLFFPKSGTMAGNDFNQHNLPIDGLLTDSPADRIEVNVLGALPLFSPKSLIPASQSETTPSMPTP